METVGQPQVPPCQCHQPQLGDLLPWLVLGLAVVLLLDRLGRRRKKQQKLPAVPAESGDGKSDT